MNKQIEALFEDLHALAEPSWHEVETTKFLKSNIPSHMEIIPFERTGFVAIQHGTHEGKTIGFRTDIDALTFFEDEKYYRHSCGHDAHMTTLLTLINNMPLKTKHTYKFIFQPAEEEGEGAKYVVDSSVMDDIDFLYGMHLRPQEELKTNEFSNGIQHGSSASIAVTIKTSSGHAARPFQSVNAIGRAVILFQLLKELHFKEDSNVMINMTQLNTLNENSNSIPGEIHLTLDVRAKTNRAMTDAIDAIQDTVEKLDAETECEVKGRTYAAEINDEAARYLANAIKKNNELTLKPPIVTPGAEDFHMYTSLRPSIKAVMLGIGCDMNHGLHHPEMTFDHHALEQASEIFMDLIQDLESRDL